mmetsp:Transcript_16579/g.18554  ORF Transcript_16579/g.18554 Transcript_16579/m.18554 type:complete len:268 (-) Transcript_16579:381-1184(-)
MPTLIATFLAIRSAFSNACFAAFSARNLRSLAANSDGNFLSCSSFSSAGVASSSFFSVAEVPSPSSSSILFVFLELILRNLFLAHANLAMSGTSTFCTSSLSVIFSACSCISADIRLASSLSTSIETSPGPEYGSFASFITLSNASSLFSGVSSFVSSFFTTSSFPFSFPEAASAAPVATPVPTAATPNNFDFAFINVSAIEPSCILEMRGAYFAAKDFLFAATSSVPLESPPTLPPIPTPASSDSAFVDVSSLSTSLKPNAWITAG